MVYSGGGDGMFDGDDDMGGGVRSGDCS